MHAKIFKVINQLFLVCEIILCRQNNINTFAMTMINDTAAINHEQASGSISRMRAFVVPLKFINKNTIINAEFARQHYHVYHYFDPMQQQKL